MRDFTLPPTPTDLFGARLDQLVFANCVQWLVTIPGHGQSVDRELFDHEAVARDWAVAQADMRHLIFLVQCEPEAT